jgi:hypothetical protein
VIGFEQPAQDPINPQRLFRNTIAAIPTIRERFTANATALSLFQSTNQVLPEIGRPAVFFVPTSLDVLILELYSPALVLGNKPCSRVSYAKELAPRGRVVYETRVD